MAINSYFIYIFHLFALWGESTGSENSWFTIILSSLLSIPLGHKIQASSCFPENPKFQYQSKFLFTLKNNISNANIKNYLWLELVRVNKVSKHMGNITPGIVNFQDICLANLEKLKKAAETVHYWEKADSSG